jgi:hypothetical protein
MTEFSLPVNPKRLPSWSRPLGREVGLRVLCGHGEAVRNGVHRTTAFRWRHKFLSRPEGLHRSSMAFL